MSLAFMNEFVSRLNNCKSEQDYINTLNWGVTSIETTNLQNSFENPIAVMVIEVFIKCPSAVEICASTQECVARIHSTLPKDIIIKY